MPYSYSPVCICLFDICLDQNEIFIVRNEIFLNEYFPIQEFSIIQPLNAITHELFRLTLRRKIYDDCRTENSWMRLQFIQSSVRIGP